MDYKKLDYKKLDYILHKVNLSSQVNKDNIDNMERGFTQEELDKITLSAEQLEHYSKPDELKRLLLERDFYKKVMEKQIENINKASTHLNSILDTPINITHRNSITKSLRDFGYYYKQNKSGKQLLFYKNMPTYKIYNTIEYLL